MYDLRVGLAGVVGLEGGAVTTNLPRAETKARHRRFLQNKQRRQRSIQEKRQPQTPVKEDTETGEDSPDTDGVSSGDESSSKPPPPATVSLAVHSPRPQN